MPTFTLHGRHKSLAEEAIQEYVITMRPRIDEGHSVTFDAMRRPHRQTLAAIHWSLLRRSNERGCVAAAALAERIESFLDRTSSEWARRAVQPQNQGT